MSDVIAAASSASGSLLNMGKESRAGQKNALNSTKTQKMIKRSVFPTVAMGDVTTPPILVSDRAADFYRYGRFVENKVNKRSIDPRQFNPIELKMPSSIRIYGKGKTGKKNTDLIPAYTKFILEGVQEGHVERSQIIETFGDFYVFMFGERPPMYTFSGQLINAQYTNWVNDFTYMYNQYFRGTRCVEQKATALLTYDGRQVSGLILGMQTQTNATIEGAVPVTFNMVVFERRYLLFSDDMGLSTNDDNNLNKDEKFTQLLQKIAGPEGYGLSSSRVSNAYGAAKKVSAGGKSQVAQLLGF